MDVSALLASVNITVNIVNKEFTPTMSEIQTILKHTSSISEKADQAVNNIYDNIDKASEKTGDALRKTQLNITSILIGIKEGLSTFLSK